MCHQLSCCINQPHFKQLFCLSQALWWISTSPSKMFLLTNIHLSFWYSSITRIILTIYLFLYKTIRCGLVFCLDIMRCDDILIMLQGFIILSCVIAVSVNFSTFLVIGKTSPVTYQVLGHLKTCLVLGFGYTLLHDPFTERNIIGILVAIVGMGLYSYFCTHENKKKQMVDLSPGSQVPLSTSLDK